MGNFKSALRDGNTIGWWFKSQWRHPWCGYARRRFIPLMCFLQILLEMQLAHFYCQSSPINSRWNNSLNKCIVLTCKICKINWLCSYSTGRRRMFFISCVIHVIFNVPLLARPSYGIAVALRFFSGLAFQANYQMPYVIGK